MSAEDVTRKPTGHGWHFVIESTIDAGPSEEALTNYADGGSVWVPMPTVRAALAAAGYEIVRREDSDTARLRAELEQAQQMATMYAGKAVEYKQEREAVEYERDALSARLTGLLELLEAQISAGPPSKLPQTWTRNEVAHYRHGWLDAMQRVDDSIVSADAAAAAVPSGDEEPT